MSASASASASASTASEVKFTRPRTRKSYSCTNCRGSKIKCDRAFPCSQCTTRSISDCCCFDDGCTISKKIVTQVRPLHIKRRASDMHKTLQHETVALRKQVEILQRRLNLFEGKIANENMEIVLNPDSTLSQEMSRQLNNFASEDCLWNWDFAQAEAGITPDWIGITPSEESQVLQDEYRRTNDSLSEEMIRALSSYQVPPDFSASLLG